MRQRAILQGVTWAFRGVTLVAVAFYIGFFVATGDWIFLIGAAAWLLVSALWWGKWLLKLWKPRYEVVWTHPHVDFGKEQSVDSGPFLRRRTAERHAQACNEFSGGFLVFKVREL